MSWEHEMVKGLRARGREDDKYILGDVLSPKWDSELEEWVGPLEISIYGGRAILRAEHLVELEAAQGLHEGMRVGMIGRQKFLVVGSTGGGTLSVMDRLLDGDVTDTGLCLAAEDELEDLAALREMILAACPFFVKQPKRVTAADGATVVFTVKAVGEGLTYQWKYKSASATSWSNSSNKTARYSFSMRDTYNGRSIRCDVTDKHGNTEESDVVTVTLA